jgi:hypothetical protein
VARNELIFMPVLDGPGIVYVEQNLEFGSENIGQELPDSPIATYSGGNGIGASGFSSYLGQLIVERDMQPYNACSNAISPGLVSLGNKNTSYIG